MFCPKCGTLSFPDPSGKITCPNYKCGYVGGAKLVIKGTDGEDVDLFNVKSETKSEKREYEVIKDSDKMQGFSPRTPTCAQNVMLSKYMHTLNKLVHRMNQKQEC